jgi:outer membrane protein
MLQVLKISRLVDVGNLSKAELLQVNAQAASEKLNVATGNYTLNMSILELTQLLDLDSLNNFEIVRPLNLSVESLGEPEPVEEIFRMAVNQLPQIKSSEYEVKIAEKQLALQKGRIVPKVTLGGLYYSRYLKGAYNPLDPGFEYFYKDQLRDNQYSQLSVGLDIPVFNRMNVKINISKAKIQLEDSHYALEQNIQFLYKSIQQVHSNALAALEKYHAALEAVTSNEEAFNYTQQKFEVGLVNSVDYNVAKNDLLKAISDLLQAKYEFIFRMKIIDFYKGKEISL